MLPNGKATTATCTGCPSRGLLNSLEEYLAVLPVYSGVLEHCLTRFDGLH